MALPKPEAGQKFRHLQADSFKEGLTHPSSNSTRKNFSLT